MSSKLQQYQSHLFTVRLWQEKLGDGQVEWRGKVQYVSSGEARYFRDWPTLIAFLLMLLPTYESCKDLEGGKDEPSISDGSNDTSRPK